MKQKFLNLPQPLRFVFVGIFNTSVDFSFFFIAINVLGAHFFFANIISTSVALIISFILNATLTFDNRMTKENAVLFLAVTLVGLWLLQPAIISFVVSTAHFFELPVAMNSILVVAKVCATGASLIWNFFLYKHVVFRSK